MSRRETKKNRREILERPEVSDRLVVVFRIGFLLATLGLAALWTVSLVQFLAANSAGTLTTYKIGLGVVYLIATGLAAAGALTLVVMKVDEQTAHRARVIVRWTLGALTVSAVFAIFSLGLHWVLLIYLYLFAWMIFFQIRTDPRLDHSKELHNPWDTNKQLEKRGYISLNFFNLFWVFMVASVVGLIVEVIFHALTRGGYQDRAGVLWGPFSPIYGFGAVLMTIALNRFWKRSKFVIFLIAGVIGSAFEFFVSFFLESAFGIVAWDYSGTFLSIDGRTNFAFMCAWGFLGLVWIKLLLPDVLRVVDAIPLSWRTGLTVATAIFMVANGVMTLLALENWYERSDGKQPTTATEKYFAEHFDNDYMANRFQSMQMNPNQASRIDQ